MKLNNLKQKDLLTPGIYAFYKPKGISSYDVIRIIKKNFILQDKKIGHAGTLDPLASGVLIILIGKEFTKKFEDFKNLEKEYIAEIYLGKTSNTYDEAGEKNKIKINKKPTIDEIKNILKEFKGEILQTPPIFSAKKIRGKPAYLYARKNMEIEIKPQKVEIKNIKILKYSWPILKIKTVVSSGTYIRSIAHNIGQKLKTGAYLKNLIRTRIGSFSIKNCIKIDKFLK